MTLTDTRTATGARENSTRPRRAGVAAGERASRSKAAQRALDRRSRRERTGGKLPLTGRRIVGMPMVVPVLMLVLGALALTLFLTTKSAQDSYAINALRKQNQELLARASALKADVDAGDQAPALAKAAARQGMVPALDSAEIVVGADGKGRLRGTPTAATGKALPDLNPEPDPVEKIDKNKVDDSVGLGGDGGTDQQSSAAPSSAPNPAPRPAPNPTPSTVRVPAGPLPGTSVRPDNRTRVSVTTNVAPPPATPRPNTAPAR